MTNHYTPLEVVKDCLSLLPITINDVVIDAGSGPDKIWYNNLNVNEKYEYEIEDGNDFFSHLTPVDWVVGNPPYSIGWKFTDHALSISKKGIGFLCSLQTINSNLIPSRLETTKRKGFGITKIHVMNISKWYGRYFFVVYEKNKPSILSWDLKYYKDV